jgi:hypothetical protein
MMSNEPVSSSTIQTQYYNPMTGELEIIFKNSPEVYTYHGVPPERHTEFLEAESKGKYLNAVIKPNHGVTKGDK